MTLDSQKPLYVKDLETSMIIGGISAEFKPLIPILQRLPIPPLQHAFAVWDRLQVVGKVAIENTRASSGKTVFSKMAAAGEVLQLSETNISREASNLTIADTDTTGIALTYLVWAILNHPHVKQKLQAELEDCSSDPLGRELETLPYLNNVIDETLRLYSPISQSLPRAVPAGGTTLCGYDLPQGTTVSTQAYTFHRDPTIYPDLLRYVVAFCDLTIHRNLTTTPPCLIILSYRT
jgi:cytochrome P450